MHSHEFMWFTLPQHSLYCQTQAQIPWETLRVTHSPLSSLTFSVENWEGRPSNQQQRKRWSLIESSAQNPEFSLALTFPIFLAFESHHHHWGSCWLLSSPHPASTNDSVRVSVWNGPQGVWHVVWENLRVYKNVSQPRRLNRRDHTCAQEHREQTIVVDENFVFVKEAVFTAICPGLQFGWFHMCHNTDTRRNYVWGQCINTPACKQERR